MPLGRGTTPSGVEPRYFLCKRGYVLISPDDEEIPA